MPHSISAPTQAQATVDLSIFLFPPPLEDRTDAHTLKKALQLCCSLLVCQHFHADAFIITFLFIFKEFIAAINLNL